MEGVIFLGGVVHVNNLIFKAQKHNLRCFFMFWSSHKKLSDAKQEKSVYIYIKKKKTQTFIDQLISMVAHLSRYKNPLMKCSTLRLMG